MADPLRSRDHSDPDNVRGSDAPVKPRRDARLSNEVSALRDEVRSSVGELRDEVRGSIGELRDVVNGANREPDDLRDRVTRCELDIAELRQRG